ncbi:MAG: glycosyltransferase N-terminal domain-containing protein [Acidobacteriota bacterium]
MLYQVVMALVLGLLGPILLLQRGAHYRSVLPARLGRRWPPPPPPDAAGRGPLWIHAVSVGEVGVAATLVDALPADLPLLVTTVTPTGQRQAQRAFGARPSTVVTYLPFELAPLVTRFVDRFAPRALVLIEGDYLPLVLRAMHQRQRPTVVVNGRVSERSFARMRPVADDWPRTFAVLGLGRISHFGMQTDADAERLRALGVDSARVTVTGNLKYDGAAPDVPPALAALVRRCAAGRSILLAGSTMAGEEAILLDAFQRIGAARALLAIAPRHPERWDAVAQQIEARGFSLARRSAIDAEAAMQRGDAPATADDAPDVLLLDSLGELAALYGVADIAFVGGTLGATGGHNPIEPARFGRPIVVGPSMHNFREIADAFTAADAWVQLAADDADAAIDALASRWRAWLDAPAEAAAVGARARGLIDDNRGAAARSCAQLRSLWADPGAGATA